MDIRLLICWHPGNIFQASVIAVDVVRGWRKMYPSKVECVTDLCRVGLLTIMDQDEVLKSDFDTKDKVLIIQTSAEAEVLEMAGFVETTPAKLN